MKTFIIVVLVIGILAILFSFYMLNRNEKVGAFQLLLVELSHNVLISYLHSLKDDSELDQEYYYKLCKYRDEICDISYNEMMWSLTRPLTIEEWLTDEQIEFLKLKF